MSKVVNIEVQGAYLFINLLDLKNKKISCNHTFDIINISESSKTLIKVLLKHWKNIPIQISYEDLQFLKDFKLL